MPPGAQSVATLSETAAKAADSLPPGDRSRQKLSVQDRSALDMPLVVTNRDLLDNRPLARVVHGVRVESIAVVIPEMFELPDDFSVVIADDHLLPPIQLSYRISRNLFN